MFKIIVAGSRDFFDYVFLKERLDNALRNITEEIEIVSGMAKGADTLGEQYAKERGYKLKQFPADWNGLGRKAGPLRNQQMAEYANACVVFRKNKSRGSTDMIERAKNHKLKLKVYDVV